MPRSVQGPRPASRGLLPPAAAAAENAAGEEPLFSFGLIADAQVQKHAFKCDWAEKERTGGEGAWPTHSAWPVAAS